MYKVLIVDSSVLTSAVISYSLSERFNVSCCSSHSDLDRSISEHRPDAVVYNIDMPQRALAGHCGYFRRPGAFGDAKLVAISVSDEGALIEMVEEGFIDGYYMKTTLMEGFSDMLIGLLEPT